MGLLRPEQRLRLIQYMTLLFNIIICSVISVVASIPPPHKDPEPYHTSILSGAGWVLELLTGHPDRIRNELGMRAELFNNLIQILKNYGHSNSRSVSLEEQLAIFLYTCVTGLPSRHVGERFQRSNDTISRYFCKMVVIFSSQPFYTTHVKPPGIDDLSPKIRSNTKFWPYFKDTIGAVDGSHLPIAPPAYLASPYRNRKGFLSQNCLFVCDFDLRFTYALTGWEGSASDARILGDACSRNLDIPDGKYLLGDLGFPSKPSILVPYRGVRYHLAEWGRGNRLPINHQELFNLRHASARNVIERAFGVLKKRFRILHLPFPYSLEIQARIPVALCAIHNFIIRHQPDGAATVPDDGPHASGQHGFGDVGPDGAADDDPEGGQPSDDDGDTNLRDRIANAMWNDYVLTRRARHMDSSSDDSDSDDIDFDM